MKSLHVFILAAVLFLTGLGIFTYKAIYLGFPLAPGEQARTWNVEVRLSFEGKDDSARIGLYIPRSTDRYLVGNENFVSSGYGLTTTYDKISGNRAAIWSVREAEGEQILYYRASIHKIRGLARAKSSPSDMSNGSSIAKPFTITDSHAAAMDMLIEAIDNESADTETFIAAMMRRLNAESPSDAVDVLLGGDDDASRKSRVAKDILEHSGYKARSVHGIDLARMGSDLGFVHWLEVEEDGAYQAYSVGNGRPGIPDGYMAWWYGGEHLVRLSGGRNLSLSLSSAPRIEDAIHSALVTSDLADSEIFRELSLFDLPLTVQSTYRFLLLVPIGALLLVFCRQVVGLQTFGTFMPVLIALSFRETALVTGITLFVLIIALGLLVRLYLERLQLLMVPRVASVLIVVVLLMALISLLSDRFDLPLGLSISLFPMVILTMTIERMSVVWEENGPQDAFQQAFGSLFVAVAAYYLMNVNLLEHLSFTFPELMLCLLAITLLLGRYTGYRLVELYRFREFSKLAR